MPSFRVNLQWAHISEILPNLYISGVTALKPTELAALGIDMIVNCTAEVPNLNIPNTHRIKLWLQDTDTEDIFAHLDTVTQQIHLMLEDGAKVLVHCVAGVSRSAAIILAYLTRYQCDTLREAYELLSERRSMVRPNLGFWRQLITYEECIKCKPASVKLVWTRQSLGEGDSSSSDDVTLVPDVYLPLLLEKEKTRSKSRSPSQNRRQSASPSSSSNDENSERRSPLGFSDPILRERQCSGKSLKFTPVLSTLHETVQHSSAPDLCTTPCESNSATPHNEIPHTPDASPKFCRADVSPINKHPRPKIPPTTPRAPMPDLDLGNNSPAIASSIAAVGMLST